MKVKVTVEFLDDLNTLAEYEEAGCTKEQIKESYEAFFKNVAKACEDKSTGLLETKINVEVTDEEDW